MAWDFKSRPYIINEGNVVFLREQVTTNAFDYSMNSVKRLCDAYKDFEKDMISNETGLDLGRGVKFDSNNHNWLLFEEYLSLPFCYLTFAL